ncbi:uncharacterized protein LOC142767087 [Rhipicephalus microplus]|uniref:uncharacterized protein LOC142767087 n=1 Tax=Rhipicephalus microplus TaxID=6941 RepID=UPI003F6B4DBB
MGSRSTPDPEEDYGSFTDEYSVRIEVYETEVTDSGGSAPIIKISGLCNAHDYVPYLIGQQCRSRFTAVDQPAGKCSDTLVYKTQLPRFQSLQVLRSGPVNSEFPNPKSSAVQDVALQHDAAKATWEIPVPDAFGGDARRKWSIPSPKLIAVDTTCTENCCPLYSCASAQVQHREQCSALGGRHPTENTGCRRSAKSICLNKDNKAASQTRYVPRSRKTTAIPSRFFRGLWGAEDQRRRHIECIDTPDNVPRSRCSCEVTRRRLQCVEQTVTTRHLPAAERRKLVRHHTCETSVQEGWGCADTCSVYRILPPQNISRRFQWDASKIETRVTAAELREVFVSASENVLLEVLGSPYPKKESSVTNSSARKWDASRVRSKATTANRMKVAACDRETQTLPLPPPALPPTVTSLVDQFALVCYEVVARLSTDASDKVGESTTENFAIRNTDIWNRVMLHVQERMASVTLPLLVGHPADGMRGEGECPIGRRARS